jgi:transporter family-2 protein
VSGGNLLAVVLGIAAGVGTSLQSAIMGKFGERVGTIEALGFSMIVAGVTGVTVLLIARRSLHGVVASWHQPKWLWIGGALSAFIVLTITFATPRIGVTAVTAMLITGSFVAATLIDRFGWFGVHAVPLRWERVLGLVLLAAGAALTLRR